MSKNDSDEGTCCEAGHPVFLSGNYKLYDLEKNEYIGLGKRYERGDFFPPVPKNKDFALVNR